MNIFVENPGILAESIVDTIREPLIILDGALKVVFANRMFYRYFKVKPEETQGRFLYDLGNHQWNIPRLRTLLEEILPKQAVMEDFEVQHTFEGVGEKIMVLNARRLEQGIGALRQLILLAIEDQTVKRIALRRLDKSETRYRRFVEELNSFIIGIDSGGFISFFNGFSEKVFGYKRAEVMGKPFVGTIVPHVDSYGTANSTIIEQILADPQKFNEVQSEGICKDGRKVFFAWSAITVPGENEQGIEIILDGNDITIAKQAQEELKRRSEELAASNKELESFSYSISHDLRAPLRAIKGLSSILVEDCAASLDCQSQDLLHRIERGVDKMGGLIDDMLNLAKISRAEINVQEIDLSALAASVVDELRVAEPERKVTVVIARDLKAIGDKRLMNIALSNLIGNAWKYSGKTANARVEFGELERGGQKIYYVRDNGVGFDMKHAQKLFAPFQRLHTDRDFPGTGIGLAIVGKVIRRHGGRIWGESEVGKGATFYFTIPKRGGG